MPPDMTILQLCCSSWDAYPLPTQLPSPMICDPSLPLISIVTPSYNQGAFIRDTIESVLSQDYPNLEYWVIDGGSNDETVALLREYESDPRFHWLSEPDRGQADAVNKGWRRCRGELLGWLNSDDTYFPHALWMLAGPLLQQPDLGIVYGDALRITTEGQSIERMYGRPFDLPALLRDHYMTQPAVLQRRRVVESTGPLRLDLHYTLDFDFYLRAVLRFKAAYVPQLCAT